MTRVQSPLFFLLVLLLHADENVLNEVFTADDDDDVDVGEKAAVTVAESSKRAADEKIFIFSLLSLDA